MVILGDTPGGILTHPPLDANVGARPNIPGLAATTKRGVVRGTVPVGRSFGAPMATFGYRSVFVLLTVVGVLLAACGGAEVPLTGQLEGVVLDAPTAKASFSLVDTEGRHFNFEGETEGRLTFLYFGYTNCPDICPVHLAQLAEVFDRLPEVRRNSTVVFVTVDPERDTPEVVRGFLDSFNSDFVGLIGSQDEVEVAQEAAGVPIAVVEGTGTDYTVGHAGQMLVYAPNGFGYSVYPFGTRQSDWMHDLPILLERTRS